VKPAEPGWSVVRVEPQPAGLAWARGKVPTPHGLVSVDWRMGDEFAMTVNVPVRTLVSVPQMGKGVVTVAASGGPARPVRHAKAGKNGRAAIDLEGGGEYRIVSR